MEKALTYDITVQNGEIAVSEEAINLFKTVQAINTTIKDLEAQKAAIEKPLKEAMQKNGITSFKCEGVLTASTVNGGWNEQVDTERMKKDGIYEKYAFRTPRSGYVKITYKKEKV